MDKQIYIKLKTEDSKGNIIQNSENRIINQADVNNFCELFLNCLQKQEFTNQEILEGMKTFFINHNFSIPE